MYQLTDAIYIQADLNSKDSVTEALKGAYAVYAVTNFWETGSADTEIQQGKNIADAAKVCLPPLWSLYQLLTLWE